MTISPRAKRILRLGFALYALILVTATHWPDLSIEGPIDRPDLVLHFCAFGLWGALLAATGLLAPITTPRNLFLSTVVGILYACIDELTQGIPILHRTVGLDDLAANLAGVVAGTTGSWLLARRVLRHP